jgi:hypothetical protein
VGKKPEIQVSDLTGFVSDIERISDSFTSYNTLCTLNSYSNHPEGKKAKWKSFLIILMAATENPS